MRGHCLVFSDLRICVEPLPVPVTLLIHRGGGFLPFTFHRRHRDPSPHTSAHEHRIWGRVKPARRDDKQQLGARLLNAAAAAVPAPTSPPHPGWLRQPPRRARGCLRLDPFVSPPRTGTGMTRDRLADEDRPRVTANIPVWGTVDALKWLRSEEEESGVEPAQRRFPARCSGAANATAPDS